MANYNECVEAGLDPDEIERLQKRLERAGRDARKLGLHIFGGSGSGSLRFDTDNGPLIVANISGGNWDGGDGGSMVNDLGLEYGEHTHLKEPSSDT